MSLFDSSTARVTLSATARRRRLLAQRTQLMSTKINLRTLLRPVTLLDFFGRLAFLLLVIGVLLGVWVVSSAHLQEQLLGVQRRVVG